MSEDRERIVGALAGVAAVVGAFMPWATITTVFGSMSVNGFQDGEGDGMITGGLGALGALLLFFTRGFKAPVVIAAIAGAAIAAVGFYDLSNIRDMIDEVNADPDGMAFASTGVGLYLTIGAGIVMACCAIVVVQSVRPAPAATATLPPGSPLPPPPIPPATAPGASSWVAAAPEPAPEPKVNAWTPARVVSVVVLFAVPVAVGAGLLYVLAS